MSRGKYSVVRALNSNVMAGDPGMTVKAALVQRHSCPAFVDERLEVDLVGKRYLVRM